MFNLTNELKNDLSNCEIYPKCINNLKKEIESRISKSIIPTGESVGLICSQSIGEKNTQMTLNSFHSAGLALSLVVSGVPRFIEILNATKNQKSVQNKFQLKKKYNKDIESIQKTIGNTLKSIYLRDIIESVVIRRNIKNEEEDIWYESFFIFFSKQTQYIECIIF